MSDELAADSSQSRNERASAPQRDKGRPKPAGTVGLKLYKPGQGYYTRMGTAIGAGVLILFGAGFLKTQLEQFLPIPQEGGLRLPMIYGIPTFFILLMGIVIYWIVGRSHKANDFFIATEGEMKKVNWSTRAEVIRSTQVVVVAVIMLSAFLFLCDLVFMIFFGLIDVLKVKPGWL